MHVHSVNVSPPRYVPFRGQQVRTGIFKEPIPDAVTIRRQGLDGDTIADLRYHGGLHKAVYSYPHEHYPFWEAERGRSLPPGTFGENLTTVGLDEETVCLGDRYRVGSAILEAAQPRTPCFKLGIKMADVRFIKTFLQSGRTGIYWRVIEEGMVQSGNTIELTERSKDNVSIRDVWAMIHNDRFDEMNARIVTMRYLVGPEWREPLEERLSR